jgi:SPX domain protein involved in polyphosphate accumulation
MAIEVFNRVEKKYMLNQKAYEAIQFWMDKNMQKDAFYSLQSLYFDTQDYDLIKQSLSKPTFKKKLRLRAYGIPNTEDNVYLEIKMKYKGVVHKRRSMISLKDVDLFLNTCQLPIEKKGYNMQVLKEVQFMLMGKQLQPSILISYDRKAYSNAELRMTIDQNIRTRTEDFSLCSNQLGKALLDEQTYLLEIKAKDSMPIALAQLLSDFKIYPTSFSKYGYAYTKGELKPCSMYQSLHLR